uniref:Uncharacterized protein n=1 Tax=Panagrolaimus superbus TaxID=310955 RepID=A0A914XVK3_9BILA
MNEMDLAAAADMLQCNIAVWERNGHWTLYNSLSFAKGLTIQHEAILEHPTILLNNSNCEHNFFNPVINVVPRNGENDERIFDDVIMEEEEEEEQNLGMENDRDTFQNMDVDELTKNMQELNLIFNEHPGNTETLNLSSLNIENFDDRDMPSEVKTLNLSKNKLEYLRFQKNYKFLKRLDLDNNKLKDIAWETFPIFLEYISLNNNFITSIINLQIHFKFLKHLNLNNNQLSSIPWEDLPISLKVISLNRNYLTSIKTVKHLKQLRRISMSRNKLTEITPDFNELKNLNEIELDYNNLKSLPKGFELIQTLNEDGLSINLACNKFDYEKQDLNEDLWTKLPLIKRLYIWENKIDTLPCQLADKLEADSIIIASDCYIVHVCPKIYSKFKKLDLNDNFLDSLTFIPATILQPPKKQHKIAVESSFDQKVLNMHVSISKPPETFPKFLEKPKYSFNKVKARENLNKIQCKCCAVCGNDQNTFNIQQMMVMDFNLCIDFEYEEVENNYDTKETIFPSGEWISKIRTRLCNSCKNELLKKCENSFETFINENSEIKSKQARIEETDNIDLKECHRSMNKNNDQINKELINQQQPSTSSSMIVPLIRNNYLMEVCSYNSAPIPENIEEQRGQDFRATEIFMQETTQEQNLAVENNATFNWNPVGQLQSSKFPLNDHLYHHTTDPTVSTISEIWQQNNEMLADSVYTDTYISSFTAFNDSYLGESLNQTFKQQPLNIQESHFTSNFPDDPTTIDNFSNIIQDISPGQTFEEYLESQYFPQPILPLNNNIFEASLPQSNNNNINSHEDPQAATSSSTTYYYYTNL